MSYFPRSAFNDGVAEHRDDHDEEEVASVHQVQVDERAIVLQETKRRRRRRRRRRGGDGEEEEESASEGMNQSVLVTTSQCC